jgi:uncharacterized repeat protein (TIGR01451 family)
MSLALVLVLMAGLLVAFASAAQAQVEDTGASATKVCVPAPPGDPYTIGDSVPCVALFANTGASNATVTQMTDIHPFIAIGDPGNGVPVDIECTLIVGGTVIGEGDTLGPGQICRADFLVQIPNDVALCNTVFRDLASIDLSYPLFDPPLTAFAGASATTLVVCPPEITVEKTADVLGKITDPVNYTIEVCNTGLIPVTKTSVTDSLIDGVDAAFGATLAPGACELESFQRVVEAGDPDPVVNTVTAIYTAGIQTATATDSAETNLFQPAVNVTKSCSPDPITVGAVETCVIDITNGSSADSPNLENGTISDTLTGNLLDAANTAVTASNCAAVLPTGGSCQITTARTVLDTDPSPLVNTVTVHYNPVGFPNDITDTASDSVIIEEPPGGEGCTPGFWRQPQHFDQWTGFAPSDLFDVVFGVDITLDAFGKTPANANPTLLDAVTAGGGGINALARHAVAALLNSTNPDVDSVFTTAQVIALVQNAVAGGPDAIQAAHLQLAAANELGCPLS